MERKEIVEKNNKFEKDNVESLEYTSIYAIKEILGAKIWNREDYKKIVHEMSKIKEEIPNIMNFIEESEIVELTEKEIKALRKYLSLAERAQEIELVESFKLGLKVSLL